jgi:hypothetical protein
MDRLGGLRRFAVSLTAFNILGHTLFGFEQSWAQPLLAIATAYVLEMLLEVMDARVNDRQVEFLKGRRALVDFLLSAHITGLAVAMLLYSQDRLAPIVFGCVVAIAGKAIFRAQVGASARHFVNPSNFGITITLLAFPAVGIAPPYHFTASLGPIENVALVVFIITLGTLLNAKFTQRLPLIAAWLGGFALQALLRHWLVGASLTGALMPMSGVAFLLFTFYMVTDPATTPSRPSRQVWFGLGVSAAYGALVASHVVFGMFFGLTIVCFVRGAALHVAALARSAREETAFAAGPSSRDITLAPSGSSDVPAR